MLLGIYYLIVCIVVGTQINSDDTKDLERIFKDACCDTRVLIPEWLYKYIVFMIRGDRNTKLGVLVIFGFIFYCMIAMFASWIFGFALLRSTEKLGDVFGFGLVLYMTFEIALFCILGGYWWAKTTLASRKEMQQLEDYIIKNAEDSGESIQTTDRASLIDDHMSRRGE